MVLKQEMLKKIVNEIDWGEEQEMPMSQGWAINKVIKLYKIPAIRWGYSNNYIGVETKKQYMIWKDKGGHLEFCGVVNK
jgi:hypothetical protein